jgi:DNA-directed RNA polymerase subunit beta'
MMTPLIQGGDIVEPLRERVLGRVVAVDVFNPWYRRCVCPCRHIVG